MIKINKSNKNKKGQTLDQDLILAVCSIIVIGIVIVFLYIQTSSAKDTIYEMSPDLYDPFPAAFVYTFLNEEISNEDKKEIGLNENDIYFVKDLFVLDTDLSREIVEKYRKVYLEEQKEIVGDKNCVEYYELFDNVDIDENDLLKINYGKEIAPNLEEVIQQKNYVFYIPTLNDRFTNVYFRDDSDDLGSMGYSDEFDLMNVG